MHLEFHCKYLGLSSYTFDVRRMNKVMITNNNKQLLFYNCFYSICSLHMDMSKCLLFILL